MIQTHSRIGGDAIKVAMQRVRESDHSALAADQGALAFLEVAGEIAHWHHERWDGDGYPDRLQGPTIPLAARIMAVADVFDALTSKRVYKEAIPHDEAVEIIRAEQGRQFDPTLVEIFLNVEPRFAKIARRLADGLIKPA